MKTESTANASCEKFETFQNCWEAPVVESLFNKQKFLNPTTLSRNLSRRLLFQKAVLLKNSEKFSFIQSCRLFEGVLKILENSQEKLLWSFFRANCKPSNNSLQSYLACFRNYGKFLR